MGERREEKWFNEPDLRDGFSFSLPFLLRIPRPGYTRILKGVKRLFLLARYRGFPASLQHLSKVCAMRKIFSVSILSRVNNVSDFSPLPAHLPSPPFPGVVPLVQPRVRFQMRLQRGEEAAVPPRRRPQGRPGMRGAGREAIPHVRTTVLQTVA